MDAQRTKSSKFSWDLALPVAALITIVFYWFVGLESMQDSLLRHYTSEHAVEYVVVAFFIWGMVDLAFRIGTFPREFLAQKLDWLPKYTTKEPISQAASLITTVETQPLWARQTRLGQRFINALNFVVASGSADTLKEYLRDLEDQDHDRTHANYGLARFIGWVMPVLGFLGTVIHFGTALSGISFEELNEKLAEVVGEMGAAFNTTTAAIGSSIAIMLALFLCERWERSIVRAIDRRVERELLHRFEVVDAELSPYIHALETAGGQVVAHLNASGQQSLASWSEALTAWQRRVEELDQRHMQVWQQSLTAFQERLEQSEAKHNRQILEIVQALSAQKQQQDATSEKIIHGVAEMRGDLVQVARAFADLNRGEGRLVELQASLAENLRVLRETQQIDEALHGLTAAIHLLTAKNRPTVLGRHEAA